ncbi:MAG: ARMT1-like domain-containing protein [Proteobacteria bacterium]|nr:ARMT1-like domain-containing protein [Pseudomonadota bacterium]
MFIWPDCIPCILKMSLGAGRLAIKEEDLMKDFMSEVLKLRPFCGENWHVLAGEVIRDIWYILEKITGEADPMKEIKINQNNMALDIYSAAKELVLKNHDPFIKALKLSIAGNDLYDLVSVHDKAMERLVPELEKYVINIKNVEVFKDRLSKAKRLVYFSDNCGEIVFDRLLLEVICHDMHDLETTFVTRTLPVLNDATLNDARSVGIEEVAEVIENGTQEPIAGTILAKVSPRVRLLVERADLLISKGGANYDCLTEEPAIKGKITYLLHGKCYPYCTDNNVPVGSLIVRNG